MTYDVFGQAGAKRLRVCFAGKQDSLFLRAYESRDVHQYEQLMLEFLPAMIHFNRKTRRTLPVT